MFARQVEGFCGSYFAAFKLPNFWSACAAYKYAYILMKVSDLSTSYIHAVFEIQKSSGIIEAS